MSKKKYKNNTQPSKVDETVVNYIQKNHMYSYINSIDESLSYSDFLKDKMLIINTIRKGLPYGLFHQIKQLTPFSEDDWADYLNVSKKTLQRHSKDSEFMFKPIHTEKIIELAEVTHFGEQVFDSLDQFYLWLNTPSFALGNLKPAELLKDSYGKEMVMNELNRIDQGIFV